MAPNLETTSPLKANLAAESTRNPFFLVDDGRAFLGQTARSVSQVTLSSLNFPLPSAMSKASLEVCLTLFGRKARLLIPINREARFSRRPCLCSKQKVSSPP